MHALIINLPVSEMRERERGDGTREAKKRKANRK